jgi:hypothetical protein
VRFSEPRSVGRTATIRPLDVRSYLDYKDINANNRRSRMYIGIMNSSDRVREETVRSSISSTLICIDH